MCPNGEASASVSIPYAQCGVYGFLERICTFRLADNDRGFYKIIIEELCSMKWKMRVFSMLNI